MSEHERACNLCVHSNSGIGAGRKQPRLRRMPHHIEYAEIVVRLVRLQFLQRNDQRILQQITEMENGNVELVCTVTARKCYSLIDHAVRHDHR